MTDDLQTKPSTLDADVRRARSSRAWLVTLLLMTPLLLAPTCDTGIVGRECTGEAKLCPGGTAVGR